MNQQAEPSALSSSLRVASIDVFRGLTILAMVFVNDLATGKRIPAWMKHVPPDRDGMTFVDVVFPAFLFIVGMAIPLAIGRRVERGESSVRIAGHVLVRTVGLLLIGVFMVNIGPLDAKATGISRSLWTFWMFAGVILVWNQYPRCSGWRRHVFVGMRLAGAIGLIALALAYRGEAEGAIGGMRTRWWGIVGLIGWAYLTASMVYLAFRREPAGVVGAIGLLVGLFVGDKSGALDVWWLATVREYVWIGGQIGGHSTITVAGMAVTILVLPPFAKRGVGRRIVTILGLAAGLACAGYLLEPLYGISKTGATPAWCLYSAAICCVVFSALHLIVDVGGWTRWAKPVEPAARNPLLAYILPSILWSLIALLGFEQIRSWQNEGLAGIIRSAVFAFAIVGLTALLTRVGVRLRL